MLCVLCKHIYVIYAPLWRRWLDPIPWLLSGPLQRRSSCFQKSGPQPRTSPNSCTCPPCCCPWRACGNDSGPCWGSRPTRICRRPFHDTWKHLGPPITRYRPPIGRRKYQLDRNRSPPMPFSACSGRAPMFDHTRDLWWGNDTDLVPIGNLGLGEHTDVHKPV